MDQDTKKMTRTAIYVAAGGYLLYLAYQLFGRLSESTGLSIRSVWQPWCCLQQAGQA